VIRRTFDPALLNTVINHPEVRPWMAPGDHALDVTPVVGNPANYALVTEGGGFLLHCLEPGLYEVHSQFLPEHRTHTREAMRAGFEYMFTRTDCVQIVTQVPDNNRAAQCLAKAARFRPMFHRKEGLLGPTEYVGLTVDQWAQDNPKLEAEGERFHGLLEEAKKANGSELPAHGHDAAHERAVGAAVRMIKAGNAAKGVNFYNRWARFAGYAPITLISAQPVVIDVVDAVVGLADNDMEILSCR
jgi:hypothetical protein